MKRLLYIILLISVQSFAQTKPLGYQQSITPTSFVKLQAQTSFLFPRDTIVQNTDSGFVHIAQKAGFTWVFDTAGFHSKNWKAITIGTGSVTSVNASATGALGFTGGPITNSGTLALGWTGLSTDYVKGNGSLGTFSTDVQAIGNPIWAPLVHTHLPSDIINLTTYVRNLFSAGSGLVYNPTLGQYSYPGDSAGINSLNGLTDAIQYLDIDTTFNGPAGWSSVGTTHTLRLPARLFNGITSETDPTVATEIKNIPVSADASANKYLNWNGSAYTRKQIAYSEVSGTPDLSGYELLSNKSTSTSLGTSNTLYPSQNAVKTYVDAADANNVKLTGNQTINGVKTFNDEVHSYGGFSVVDPNGSLETAFLTYENVSSTYGGGLKLRSTGGNSNTLYAATTLSTNRTNRLPNVTGTLANSVTVNGTNYTSDGNGVIDIGTITSGGSGTVNSGTQYRIGYYAGTGTEISEAPAITGNRALISDANGVPTHSTVTATELAHLVGVTSPIQGQLDSKEAAFLSGSEEFTGSTSMSVTIANTPLSTKEESYYLNGLVIKAANISRVGTTVTFTGFVRESSDIITAKYAYLAP